LISASTYGFAFALVAVPFASLVWIIWLRLTLALESQRATTTQLQKTLHAIAAELRKGLSEAQRAAPATLAAEVADLAAAVSRLRTTQQRFQGRFDQYVGQERAAPSLPLHPGGVHDPELEAELALQLAPAAGPR